MTPEFTTSPAYEITAEMIRQRIGRKRTAFWKYRKLGYLPQGKRKKGLRGLYYTAHQANGLLSSLGSTAERF